MILHPSDHDGQHKHNFKEEDFRKLRKCCSETSETPICRPVFNQPHFDEFHQQVVKDKPTKRDLAKKVMENNLTSSKLRANLFAFFPIITWMSNYDLKADLVPDIVSGVTVALFHVPQTLGYSLIVGVPAINGLYTATFPMLMYAFFGTSRQNSIGAFAVVCVMTGGVVRSAAEYFGDTVSAVVIVSTLAFFVGLFQLIMGILSMGGLSVFLSEQFVSGFTAGVSFHIGTSQLGGLFGFSVRKFSGPFLAIETFVDFFKNIEQTHLPTLGLAVACMVVILAVKFLVDPYLVAKFRMPLPIELVVVIITIALSRFLNLPQAGISVVSDIPNKLEPPAIPAMTPEIIKFIIVDALLIAVISFTVNVSLGQIWAREKGYKIQPNQEFFALGLSNAFGSLFACFPVGASVPRSSLQLLSGGRTQLVSFINSCLLILAVLFLGPLLDGLPKATLSAIIVVSLKKVFMQVKDFKNFWDISVVDGQVWLVSFFATVIIDVVHGLLIGVVFSLLTLIYKVQRPNTFLLGSIPNSDYYVPLKLYRQAREVPGVKIFQFGGPLHFANVEFFRSELAKKCDSSYTLGVSQVCHKPMRFLILDFSRVTFIDGPSASSIKELTSDYSGVTIYMACCSPSILEILKRADVHTEIPETNFYPSVHDAVMLTHNSQRHNHSHRTLESIGRQASFQQTFGPDSIVPEVFEHKVDLTDESHESKL